MFLGQFQERNRIATIVARMVVDATDGTRIESGNPTGGGSFSSVVVPQVAHLGAAETSESDVSEHE